MNKILVHHSKYGDTFFDASTPELEEHACLALFKMLDRDHSYDILFDEYDIHELDEKIKELQSSTECDCAICLRNRQIDQERIKTLTKEKNDILKLTNLIIQARQNNIVAARKVLYMRNNGEYEHFEIVEAHNPLEYIKKIDE